MKTFAKKIFIGFSLVALFILISAQDSLAATVQLTSPVVTGPDVVYYNDQGDTQFSVAATSPNPYMSIRYKIYWGESTKPESDSDDTYGQLYSGDKYYFTHTFPSVVNPESIKLTVVASMPGYNTTTTKIITYGVIPVSSPVIRGPDIIPLGSSTSYFLVDSNSFLNSLSYKVYENGKLVATSSALSSSKDFPYTHKNNVKLDAIYNPFVITAVVKDLYTSATSTKEVTYKIIPISDPVISGPTSVALGSSSVLYSISSTNTNSKGITYNIYVNNSAKASTTCSLLVSGKVCAFSLKPSTTMGGTYNIKAVATDGYSTTTSNQDVIVQTQNLTEPVISGPDTVALGSSTISYRIYSTNANSKTINYRVYINDATTTITTTGAKNTKDLVTCSGLSGVACAFYLKPSTTVSGTYNIKVVAADGISTSTSNRDINVQTVNLTDPVISGPASVALGSSTISYRIYSNNTNGSIINYRVYIDDSATTIKTTGVKNTTNAITCSGLSGVVCTFKLLVSTTTENTYKISVNASDGYSTTTSNQDVIVQTQNLTEPVISGPNTVALGSSTISYSIYSTNANSKIINYRVYINDATTTITTTGAKNTKDLVTCSGLSGVVCTFKLLVSTTTENTYKISVNATDGYSSITKDMDVSVQTLSLTNPVISGPNTVALGSIAATFTTVSTNTNSKTISYYVYLNNSTNTITVKGVNNKTAAATCTGKISGAACSFMIPALTSAGITSIKVIATDGYTTATSTRDIVFKKIDLTDPVISGPDVIALGSATTNFTASSTNTNSKTINYFVYFNGETTTVNTKGVKNTTNIATCSSLVSGTSCSFAVPTLKSAGTTTITVVANDGYTTATSTRDIVFKTVPPTKAIITSSYNQWYVLVPYVSVYFQIVSTSSISKPIKYYVYFDGSSTIGTTSKSINSGAVYLFEKQYTQSGTSTIKVVATDGYGTTTTETSFNIAMSTGDFIVNNDNGQATLSLLRTYKVGASSGVSTGCFSQKSDASLAIAGNDNGKYRRNVLQTVMYFAQVIDENTKLPLKNGDTVSTNSVLRLHFIPHTKEHLSYFLNGGVYDSPYGYWASPESGNPIPPKSSRETLTCNNSSSGLGFTVVEPIKSFEHSDSLICSMANDSTSDKICTIKSDVASGTPLTANFNFSQTIGFLTSDETALRPLQDSEPISKVVMNAKYLKSPYVTFPTQSDYVTIPFTFKLTTATNTPTVKLNSVDNLLNGQATGTVLTPYGYIVQASTTGSSQMDYYINFDTISGSEKILGTDYINIGTFNPNAATTTYKIWTRAGVYKVCAVAKISGQNLQSDPSCLTVNISSLDLTPISANPSSSCDEATGKISIKWLPSNTSGTGYYLIYRGDNPNNPIASTTATSYGGLDADSVYYVSFFDKVNGITSSLLTIKTIPECDICKSPNYLNDNNICTKPSTIDTCPVDSYWNNNTLICESCPSTSTWDGINNKCVAVKCSGDIPLGYVLANSTATSSDSAWNYVPNNYVSNYQQINSVNQLQSCQWTCYPNTDTESYSKLGNECVVSIIKLN